MVGESWRTEYRQQLDRAKIADLTAANEKIANTRLNDELSDAGVEILALKDSLDKERAGRTADKALAVSERAVQAGHYDSLKVTQVELQKDLEAALAMMKQLRTEKVALSTKLETANDVARGLKKDLDELTVQNKRLEALARYYAVLIKDLREELQEVRTELADLKVKGVTKGTGDTTAAVTSDEPIHGTVTAVSSGVASINIGQAKGIRKNMMLKVYRGGKFVCHLRIDMVEADSAAGVVLDSQLDVMQGDKVATDLNK